MVFLVIWYNQRGHIWLFDKTIFVFSFIWLFNKTIFGFIIWLFDKTMFLFFQWLDKMDVLHYLRTRSFP